MKEHAIHQSEEIISEKEIERKFLAQIPENLQEFPRTTIVQGYLTVDDQTETRIRVQDNQHFLTLKKGSGLVRDEKEIPISPEQFQMLWPETEGRRVAKDRYLIPYQHSTIELDIYKGNLEGLIVAEVEFTSIEASMKFAPPSWLSTEVTGDKTYNNQQLALQRQIPGHAENKIYKEQTLKDGVKEVIDLIQAKKSEKTPVIVMVAGRTSSGKTTAVSSDIQETFGAKVLSMDDYSKGNSFVAEMASKGTPINWDHPAYIDFDLLNEHITSLKQGESIEKPTFSFKTGERDVSETFEPSDVIIVEGLFALREEMQQHGDVKTFVDISLHGSIIRRLLRDVKRTNMEPVAILRYYLTTVEPMYQEHIGQTKDNADVVLLSEYNPAHEAGRSETYEVQAKFKKPSDIRKTLQKVGAEFLGKMDEKDTYIEPKDKDFSQSDEALRIRRKGESLVLGYKGPRLGSGVRMRPKFEFEIDGSIEQQLLDHYKGKVTDIVKTRSVYYLDGSIVTVDEDVAKTQGQSCTPLGSFVEVRSANKEKGEEEIKIICQKLGLHYGKKIIASYKEM